MSTFTLDQLDVSVGYVGDISEENEYAEFTECVVRVDMGGGALTLEHGVRLVLDLHLGVTTALLSGMNDEDEIIVVPRYRVGTRSLASDPGYSRYVWELTLRFQTADAHEAQRDIEVVLGVLRTKFSDGCTSLV